MEETENEITLVMEYIEGDSLKEWTRREQLLPVHESIRVVQKIASAIGSMHRVGLLHRDIKPSNIYLRRSPATETTTLNPVVIDFGMFGRTKDSVHVPAGTPQYMAPERWSSSQRQLSEAADVYSLGVILYELVTGGSPFGKVNSLAELLSFHTNMNPIPPRKFRPDLHVGLEDIVLRSLHKDPTHRIPSMLALHDELESWLRSNVTYIGRSGLFSPKNLNSHWLQFETDGIDRRVPGESESMMLCDAVDRVLNSFPSSNRQHAVALLKRCIENHQIRIDETDSATQLLKIADNGDRAIAREEQGATVDPQADSLRNDGAWALQAWAERRSHPEWSVHDGKHVAIYRKAIVLSGDDYDAVLAAASESLSVPENDITMDYWGI